MVVSRPSKPSCLPLLPLIYGKHLHFVVIRGIRHLFYWIYSSLNEPRYASLPNIMKAKKKPLVKLTPEDLGIDISPRIETLKVEEPPKRVGGRKVESVDELVDKLRNEAKVL
jgi:hypothetical protein